MIPRKGKSFKLINRKDGQISESCIQSFLDSGQGVIVYAYHGNVHWTFNACHSRNEPPPNMNTFSHDTRYYSDMILLKGFDLMCVLKIKFNIFSFLLSVRLIYYASQSINTHLQDEKYA